jgi:hypothetical protein
MIHSSANVRYVGVAFYEHWVNILMSDTLQPTWIQSGQFVNKHRRNWVRSSHLERVWETNFQCFKTKPALAMWSRSTNSGLFSVCDKPYKLWEGSSLGPEKSLASKSQSKHFPGPPAVPKVSIFRFSFQQQPVTMGDGGIGRPRALSNLVSKSFGSCPWQCQ